MKRYDGKAVLVTGAVGAIGKQLAIAFLQRGASVGAIDLDSTLLQQLVTELSPLGMIVSETADITHRMEIASAINRLEQKLGPAEIMIANAGVALNNPIDGFDAVIFEKQVQVNLIGMANTLAPIIPGMIVRQRGHIVALSSLASYRGLPHMAGYCASKAGVSAFMDSLRIELKPHGIRCTTICPSYIRSGMNASLGVPTPGILSAEEAVARMMVAIEKERPYLAFPWFNHFLLVLGQLLPTWLGDWLTVQKTGVVLQKPSPTKRI
jgi:NADP-dependent 3-hydroxy acid dehydrogenase YdfG